MIAAALVGVALGVGVVTLLMLSPTDDVGAAGPVAISSGVAQPEPVGTGMDAGDDSLPTGTEVVAGSGATAPGSVVVDQAVAEQAALAYLGEGQVTWVSAEDDHDAAWEIEVTLPTGREVDVYVDPTGQVVRASEGLARLLP